MTAADPYGALPLLHFQVSLLSLATALHAPVQAPEAEHYGKELDQAEELRDEMDRDR